MPSGKLQLAFTNNQDIHLTGNPQITFFKAVFKRHTNFSIESVEQIPFGDLNYSKRFKVSLKKIGDLVHQIYLVIKTNSTSTLGGNSTYINWVNNTAHSLIEKVSIQIGENVIDEHDGVFLDILSELNDPTHEDWPLLNKHAANNAYLINRDTLVPNKLFIPLQFWFCKNPGMALPIVSLDRTVEVVLDFRLRGLSEVINCDGTTSSVSEVSPDITVYADYIFLDDDERKMFLDSDQEYLIEQVQQLGGCGKFNDFNKIIDISDFNHPVKELIWVCRDKTAISTNTDLTNLQNINATLNTEGSTFTQKNDILNYDCANSNNLVYIGGTEQYDHFSHMSMRINGTERFKERESIYFRTVQPINYHGIFPFKKIYLYSFSLRPSDQQPTGTLNFSAIDNATLEFTGNSGNNSVISVYAVSYNILRIIKSGAQGGTGVAGLAYAD